MTSARVERSVSTWQQPVPPRASDERAQVVDELVDLVLATGSHRLRVGIDGFTAAGKTSLGHEIADGIVRRGRTVLRASLDDFKRPWRDRHRYDRLSGDGYYRNAQDTEAARALLLEPAAPDGGGVVALCAIDPITQVDHRSETIWMPRDGVLVVDGVFAFRPEIDDVWDVRIWVHVDPELSVRRGAVRDAEREGGAAAAERLHRDRYLAAEMIYLAEADPISTVHVVVDNTDVGRPIVRRTSSREGQSGGSRLGSSRSPASRSSGSSSVTP